MLLLFEFIVLLLFLFLNLQLHFGLQKQLCVDQLTSLSWFLHLYCTQHFCLFLRPPIWLCRARTTGTECSPLQCSTCLSHVNFPVTSFCISTVRFYSSLSSLFITLAHYWKLLSIFFLSNTLFVFLPVLTVMSLAQALINSCFALCHFLLSALEELHTDCLYQHHLSLLLRHITPHVNVPDSHRHPGVRSSLFCLSL